MSTSTLLSRPFRGSSSSLLGLLNPLLGKPLVRLAFCLLCSSPSIPEVRPIFFMNFLNRFSPQFWKPGASFPLSQPRSFPSHLICNHRFRWVATVLYSRRIFQSAGKSPRTNMIMVRMMMRRRRFWGSLSSPTRARCERTLRSIAWSSITRNSRSKLRSWREENPPVKRAWPGSWELHGILTR